MSSLWIDREKRRALAAWMLAGSGPSLLAVIVLIIVVLAWFMPGGTMARINWLGTIGVALACLLAISLLTYGVDQALRTIKASGGGMTFEATGQAGEVTATVANASGDTATATVPASGATGAATAPIEGEAQ